MIVNYPDAVAAAKSVTELAIQHNLITSYSTSKEIAKFYRTVYEELATEPNG